MNRNYIQFVEILFVRFIGLGFGVELLLSLVVWGWPIFWWLLLSLAHRSEQGERINPQWPTYFCIEVSIGGRIIFDKLKQGLYQIYGILDICSSIHPSRLLRVTQKFLPLISKTRFKLLLIGWSIIMTVSLVHLLK